MCASIAMIGKPPGVVKVNRDVNQLRGEGVSAIKLMQISLKAPNFGVGQLVAASPRAGSSAR